MKTPEQIAEEQAEKEFLEGFSDEDKEAPEDKTPAPKEDLPSDGDDNNWNFDEDPEDGPQDGDPAPDDDDGAAEEGKGKKKSNKEELSLEQRAHGYDSMLGRLEKERAEKARLEEELEALRSQASPSPVTDTAKDDKAQFEGDKTTFEIPEELEEDLGTIEKEEDPQLAALFREDSKDGARLRNVLEDFGTDMAVIQANALLTIRKAEDASVAFQGTIQKTAAEAHTAQIFAAVPGYEDLTTNPARAQESKEYHAELRDWVNEQPHKVAVQHLATIEKGTPKEVASLLTAFNAARGAAENAKDNKKSKAEAALAVGAKTGPLPKSPGTKDEFDEGWDIPD